jgi:hypothetical protein
MSTSEYSNTPKLIEALVSFDIVKVSCGWNHTAAVSKEG